MVNMVKLDLLVWELEPLVGGLVLQHPGAAGPSGLSVCQRLHKLAMSVKIIEGLVLVQWTILGDMGIFGPFMLNLWILGLILVPRTLASYGAYLCCDHWSQIS